MKNPYFYNLFISLFIYLFIMFKRMIESEPR